MPDTIAVLCLAIDQGDDTALPILADALEEAGDPRAEGLRLLKEQHLRLNALYGANWPGPPVFGWLPERSKHPHSMLIADKDFDALKGGTNNGGYHYYPTRSVAYLALAETLLEPATVG